MKVLDHPIEVRSLTVSADNPLTQAALAKALAGHWQCFTPEQAEDTSAQVFDAIEEMIFAAKHPELVVATV